MKALSYTDVAILALFLFSCTKEPVACINGPSTGTTGTNMSFSSCSENTHHCEWEFGDGGSAQGESVSHVYNTAGTYTVKLRAMPKKGHKHSETTLTVTIN